jgi:DNA polymerase III subunit epsilon
MGIDAPLTFPQDTHVVAFRSQTAAGWTSSPAAPVVSISASNSGRMEPTVYLFVDTETTGVPRDFSASPAATKNWPRIVQVAWIFASDSDSSGATIVRIIKPAGFVIPRDATEIHGITNQRALAEGVDLRGVLDEISTVAQHAAILIAHNVSFDASVIQSEFIRAGLPDPLARLKHRCTMKESTNYCRLPGPYGHKWPKLPELHRKLFGAGFDGSHDAGSDCSACMKCYFRLRTLGVMR